MRLVIDIETNSLVKPSKIWCIVCKDLDTGEMHVFRPTENEADTDRFLELSKNVTLWIGHNWLEYDYPILNRLIGLDLPTVADCSIDTLIVSRLVDYSRTGGHSIEQYGLEFGEPKIKFNDFKQYSQEMEDYCVRDVDICERVYRRHYSFITNPAHLEAIKLEHQFQLVVNSLHDNGFAFNTAKATKLLEKVTKELEILDEAILKEFPPKTVTVREFTPKLTKHGTISRTSVPRSLHENIHLYEADKVYKLTKQVEFNLSSHKQIIEVLNEAQWKPIDKTKTHIDAERELARLDRSRNRDSLFDIQRQACYDGLLRMRKVGWKVNENNLNTLPKDAPPPARTLAQRILFESRRRTLTEWLSLVDQDRIHGKFLGIGAWTHRMAHQRPNTANIPNELDTFGKKKLLGKEMRSLWCAPKNRLLVGVDAEGIQLRIFAHYIDDHEFTKALVDGKKEDKSDPHSLNARILGPVCKSRQAAKRFIYALLLGAGLGKLGEILGCSEDEARSALARLMDRYQGFTDLKESTIPSDAKRGWFVGLDGRTVRIPGETVSERRHLCMSGYLQNGEAVIMKKATLLWHNQFNKFPDIIGDDWKFVNFVHDEWQTECSNNMDVALMIAKTQAKSLRMVGEELKLKCPLAGSYYNDDIKDYTIATNWAYTH